MTVISELPELMLRSADATWDRAKWEQLPDDGNRYEVIDGVLYVTTAPDAELVSPTLPVRAQVASFFAGAPDTTL
jgi:hypothetical protein